LAESGEIDGKSYEIEVCVAVKLKLWMNCVCDGPESYHVSVFLFRDVCSRSMKFW